MSTLSRVNFIAQQRLDLASLFAQDSYNAFDFRSIISSFVGSDQTYIIRYLDVVSKTGLSVAFRVADCQVFNPKDPNGSMYVGLPDDPDQFIDLPANQSNVYIEASFINQTQAPVNTGVWDPLALTGDDAGGSEFTASVNTQSVIVLDISVNTVGFTEGSIPLAKASTGASIINSMEDRRPLLYRLGRGGVAPDSAFKYPFSSSRTESATFGSGVGDSDISSPWRSRDAVGAINDKGLKTSKDWMDAVMTRISEISGSSLWYSGSGSSSAVANLSVSEVFFDNDSGHYIQPSPTSTLSWKRVSSTLRLLGEGTVPLIGGNYKEGLIKWQFNYGIVEWHLGATFVSATNRSYSDVQFISPAPVDKGNIYLTLERDVVKGSGNNVSWSDNTARGTFTSLRSVSGVAGDFTGIAIGDYVRKESEGTSRYYRVAKMSDGTIDYSDSVPADLNHVANASIICLELHADIVGAPTSEPLRYFRAHYANSDVVADSASQTYIYQDANRYWLGRRNGELFILRNYGTMQEGEEVPTLNDSFDVGGSGISDLTLEHENLASYSDAGIYDLSSIASKVITIYRRKRDNTKGFPNDSDNSGALLTYTISTPISINPGQQLWVKLSDTTDGALSAGSVAGNSPDDETNTETITNVYEVRYAIDTPLRNYDNRDVYLLARSVTSASTVYGSTKELIFLDGSALGANGKRINNNLEVNNYTITPTSIDIATAGDQTWLASLGAHTLNIGGVNSTVRIRGDLMVDGDTVSIQTSNWQVDDKLISMGVGNVIATDVSGSGIEVADTTREAVTIQTTNGSSFVNTTLGVAHGFVLGDSFGISSNVNIGGITSAEFTKTYQVVTTATSVGQAQILSSTQVRLYSAGTATASTSISLSPPTTSVRVFKTNSWIKVTDATGSITGQPTSWSLKTFNSTQSVAITPVTGYGIIPTANTTNMLATRIPFVNDDNSGPAGVDSTLDFNAGFYWDNSTNTLNTTNISINSSLRYANQVSVTANTTLTTANLFVKIDTSANGADITITLPLVSTVNKGQVLIFKDVGATLSRFNKRAILDANGSQTIDGDLTVTLDIDFMSLTLVSDGVSNWMLI